MIGAVTVPALGSEAPDFTLPAWTAEGEQALTLSEQRGRPVVLAFYPGDETAVCTRQLCSYRDDLELLQEVDAVLWGVSVQDVASHRRFAEHRGLPFPLLADADHVAHRAYGVDRALMTRRAVFVVDASSRVVWRDVSRLGLTYKGLTEIRSVLDAQLKSR